MASHGNPQKVATKWRQKWVRFVEESMTFVASVRAQFVRISAANFPFGDRVRFGFEWLRFGARLVMKRLDLTSGDFHRGLRGTPISI